MSLTVVGLTAERCVQTLVGTGSMLGTGGIADHSSGGHGDRVGDGLATGRRRVDINSTGTPASRLLGNRAWASTAP